jgi:hypothetical protein
MWEKYEGWSVRMMFGAKVGYTAKLLFYDPGFYVFQKYVKLFAWAQSITSNSNVKL